MTGEQRTLPDFDDPPIVESALSVEFATLAKWRIPHFGLFWHEIQTDFTSTKMHKLWKRKQ